MKVGPFDFANLPPWLQTVIALTVVLAAVVGLIAFVRKTWPVSVQFVKTVISLQTLPEFMDKTTTTLAAQNEKIAEIHHEVQFNNGSSVKDAVTRMEQKQARVLATQTRIEKGVKGLYDRTAELERTQPRPPKPVTPKRRSTT